MAEIWKLVPSLPGVLASDEGRILFPPRHAPLPNGGYRLYVPKPITGNDCRSAPGANHVYKGVRSAFYGTLKVHQIVCEAFHGPKPFPKAVVIHLDENALNNRPENLRWGTQKENLNAPGFIEYCKSRTGENSPTVKARMKAA